VLGERIHAFVYAPATDVASLRSELAARCKAELADYKMPDGWSWLAEPLPRTRTEGAQAGAARPVA
jgi:O-succinylbenzoic acid--CoA ligase